MVDPVGEGVLDILDNVFSLSVLVEGLMDTRALEAAVVLEATAGVSGTGTFHQP